MINNSELIELQKTVNQMLHDAISDAYHESEIETSQAQAVAIIVSAVATNLGIILAQIPDSHRMRYMAMADQIVNDSLVSTIETMSIDHWGQIGHA